MRLHVRHLNRLIVLSLLLQPTTLGIDLMHMRQSVFAKSCSPILKCFLWVSSFLVSEKKNAITSVPRRFWSMQPLKFPTGPDQLVARAVKFLDHLCDRSEYVVGGGTALAARWDHRHSTDIDCFMNPESYRRAYEKNGGRLQGALETLADTYQLLEKDCGPGGITVVFADLGEFSLAPSRLLTAAPLSDECERQTGLRLEHTAEILAKKMRLRMMAGRLVQRDAYDLVVASVKDRESFNMAFDVLGDHLQRTLGPNIRWAANRGLLDPGRVREPRYPRVAGDAWRLLAEVFERKEVELGDAAHRQQQIADLDREI